MIHDVISSRNADYSFYIKCDCGKELLHFTYFSESNNCEEIIALKYYGPNSNELDDNFTFTQSNLRKISDHLKLSLNEETYDFSIDNGIASIYVVKNSLGFYTIKKKRHNVKSTEDWEICLRDFSIKIFIDELDNMYNKINNVRELKRIEWINTF